MACSDIPELTPHVDYQAMGSPNAAEILRTPESAMEPDPRTAMFVGQNPPSLTLHHQEVAAIKLNGYVPEKITIQFETARNLYFYAWHVYRFFPVSQRQALAALELGLRERLPTQLPKPYQKNWHKQPMLAGLLSYAIDQGLISNQGFSRWHQNAEFQARERRSREAIQIMIDEQLDSMELDETEPVLITTADRDWDLVGIGLTQNVANFPHCVNVNHLMVHG